jgi:hypothetical protein
MKCTKFKAIQGINNEVKVIYCDGELPFSSQSVLGEGWRDAKREYPKGHGENYLIYDGDEMYTAWPDSHSRHGWRDLISGFEIEGVKFYRSLPDPPAFA